MTVYECLAGRLPFRATTPVAILVMQATENMSPIETINPAIPGNVSQALMRALAKKPDERFPNCRAFAQDLLSAIRQSGLVDVSAMRPDSRAERIESVSAMPADRPLGPPQTQSGTRQPTRKPPPLGQPVQTQQSVWQDKWLWIVSGIATSIVAALILMVIFRSPETPQLAGDASSSSPQSASLDPETQTQTAPSGNPEGPALLVAPFDSETARQRQEAWAKFLKTEGIVQTNSIGMTLALIPAAEFQMGSPPEEKKHEEGEVQHWVRISKPFFLGTHEVTQSEFERVVGRNPSYWDRTQAGREVSRFPVERVTWFDCIEFCNKLSVLDGLEPYYTLTDIEREEGAIEGIQSATVGIAGGNGYRLPTEAQWEYACRAGTTTATHFGDSLSSMQANFNGDYPYNGGAKGPFLYRTTDVGSYPPNAFGLYDMHGNVWEWCGDGFDENAYPNSPVNDPTGIASALDRAQRGGGWNFGGRNCRSAIRRGWPPLGRGQNVGFRVTRIPAQ
jgi:formylglycine-generating enzyme required for sulfatase activity